MSPVSVRKRVTATPAPSSATEEDWLDITRLASLEITSETPEYPIEAALGTTEGAGWRAGTGGRQTLRIVFDEPQRLSHVSLEIEETSVARTQELALEWTASNGARREIVRQRWNFSPDGSTREVENYEVALSDVKSLDLVIDPDVASPTATASLRRLRLR